MLVWRSDKKLQIVGVLLKLIDTTSYVKLTSYEQIWLERIYKKYLETEIGKWPSRAEQGQAGPSVVKRAQIGPSVVKQAKAGPNRAKPGPNGAERAQTGPNGINFLHAGIFLWEEKIMQPRLSDKNWHSYGGFCWFQDFDRAPLKTLYLFS